MVDLKIGKNTFPKKYLRGFLYYEFSSLPNLIFELFRSNEVEETETSDIIYDYIKSIGYNNVSDIPKEELRVIESYYWDLKEVNKIDDEKVTYLLLSQILNGNILTIIDNELVTEINNPIILNDDSTISFVMKSKFENAEFKTL